jgi:hypothetical protein
MNLGEILDRTFEIYRSRFLVFLTIAALPALAMLGMHAFDTFWLHGQFTIRFTQQEAILWNSLVTLAIFHLSAFLGILISPAHMYLGSATSQGDECWVSKALRFTGSRWRSYLWVTILKFLAEILIPEILGLLLFIGVVYLVVYTGLINSNGNLGAISTVLLMLLLLAPGCILLCWLGSCLSLAIPACAFEEIVGYKALRRSWTLTKGSRLRILFTWMMIVVVSLIVMYGLELVVRWIFLYFLRVYSFGAAIQDQYQTTVYFLNTMLYALIGPIYPIALTLFYYDQRMRREGYDVERMMESAGMNAAAALPVEGGLVAPAAEEEVQA